jgi:hypothetical protein
VVFVDVALCVHMPCTCGHVTMAPYHMSSPLSPGARACRRSAPLLSLPGGSTPLPSAVLLTLLPTSVRTRCACLPSSNGRSSPVEEGEGHRVAPFTGPSSIDGRHGKEQVRVPTTGRPFGDGEVRLTPCALYAPSKGRERREGGSWTRAAAS